MALDIIFESRNKITKNIGSRKKGKLLCHILFIVILVSIQVKAQDEISWLELKVDSLVSDAIKQKAFPGAQVLIIHRDSTLVHKAYGHHTYENEFPVELHHLYDLASVTKIMGGGLSLMKLQEEGKFSVDLTLGETHHFFKNSNKSDLKWESILAHQAGLEPYIVFWQKMKNKKGRYKWRTFMDRPKKNYPYQINDNIFLHKRYPKLMQRAIKSSPVNQDPKYLYSGLSFLLIPEMVNERAGNSIDHYLKKEVFAPMGLSRITYRPLDYFSKAEIAPTEIDTFFRHETVQGYVHDENASMLNGVSANAGLFANASDLGEIAKMLMNYGNYKGKQILAQAIVRQYTRVAFPENDNRRGLTFDKPLLEYEASAAYIAKSASPSSFGHSGFTGTLFWVDPEHELILIFLSNRVHPFRSYRGLYSLNFRPQLHQFAYDYIAEIRE